METILSRIEATLQKYGMFSQGGRLLMACSGGPDSVVLSHVLMKLAPRLGLRPALLHFDHALRKGSEKDREFVRKLAKRFHVPFYSARRGKRSFGKELSPEEGARKLRYEFFEKVAKRTGIRKIALGHHRDDQAETVLMRLLQGTGPRGLQGIRPVLKRNGVTYLRPLIEVGRAEILEFLRRNKAAFRKDPTNHSPRYLRNRVRHRLLPLLEREYNPRTREILIRLAETASAESAGLDEWVRNRLKNFIRRRKNGTLWLKRDLFLSLPGPLQFRILDHVLRMMNPLSGLDFKSWLRLEAGLKSGRYRTSLPRNLDLALTPKALSVRTQ